MGPNLCRCVKKQSPPVKNWVLQEIILHYLFNSSCKTLSAVRLKCYLFSEALQLVEDRLLIAERLQIIKANHRTEDSNLFTSRALWSGYGRYNQSVKQRMLKIIKTFVEASAVHKCQAFSAENTTSFCTYILNWSLQPFSQVFSHHLCCVV